jgi:hypothetical protein
MGATLDSVVTLRELARDGFPAQARKEIGAEDQMALTLEAKDAVSEDNYSNAKLYRVSESPVDTDPVTFPSILSGATNLVLALPEAVEELALLSDMGDSRHRSGMFIYSLQVVAPADWSWPEGGTSLENVHSNPGRQAELRTGYFYYEILEAIPSESRSAFLSWLLRSANAFDVSIRGARGKSTSHVRVTLEAPSSRR